MTHYSSVGPPSALGQQIIDVTNADGYGAYDPDRCHGLIDPAQDDNPAVTEINADSYAWMAQDAYFSFACTTDLRSPVTISRIPLLMFLQTMMAMKLLEEFLF